MPDKEQSPSERIAEESRKLTERKFALLRAAVERRLAEKVAAHPTPDLGEDEELVERIKRKVVNARGVEVNEDTPEEERDRLYIVRRSRQRR